MERTILHLAIDSFPIQAERLRCPKLMDRPVALIPGESTRPRVAVSSREALEAGIRPGTPLVHARRLCPDLLALPLDPEFYAGIGESIFERLGPFAPLVEPGGGTGGGAGTGRFFLDLTGVARTHPEARDRAIRAGREVEGALRLHPTLGVAANKLVSRVAAQVVAPDGDLLDVSSGSEVSFLAPLPVDVLPAARGEEIAQRLDLLNVRFVREVQSFSRLELGRAFGRVGEALAQQARGVDPTPVLPPSSTPRVVVEETLPRETNDSRALLAHAARLAVELAARLSARGEGAKGLTLTVSYADGYEARARRTLPLPALGSAAVLVLVGELLGRAVKRRIRVRRLRIAAWDVVPESAQLPLWGPEPSHATTLQSTIDRARARFGVEALVPATWILHGITVRAPARS